MPPTDPLPPAMPHRPVAPMPAKKKMNGCLIAVLIAVGLFICIGIAGIVAALVVPAVNAAKTKRRQHEQVRALTVAITPKRASFFPPAQTKIPRLGQTLAAVSVSRAGLFEGSYEKAIRLTGQMARNEEAQRLAQKSRLEILDLTWEDTGRYKNSSVGPNISDMTIQVGRATGKDRFEVTCMPVIRHPNFSDTTCDLDPRDFTLLVGNQKGAPLKRVSLRQFLETPLAYLSNPQSWKPKDRGERTLLAERDTRRENPTSGLVGELLGGAPEEHRRRQGDRHPQVAHTVRAELR